MKWPHLLYSFTLTWSDIQRKVVSTRIVSTSAFRSAHQVSEWWPTLIYVFWVQRDKGEYKAFCIGGVLSKTEDTRVETANEGKFSSQTCSEQVDGVNYIKPTHRTLISKNPPTNRCSRDFISALQLQSRCQTKKINQTKLALASALADSA
jgi:hypothetical protein